MIKGYEKNIVACMESAEQTRRLAKQRLAEARADSRTEIDQQKEFGAWLRKMRNKRKLNYLWPRSDKATTIQVGHWDFTIWLPNGRELRMEFKAPGGKCSPEQEETIALMANLGSPVLIINSASEAQRLVELYLVMDL